MPAQPEYTALPLEQFIAQLQAAGFHMDTGRKLRLLRLLKSKGGEYIGRFAELKYTLAPFIASSPAEQQRFYEFFDAFIEDCNREMEQWADRLPHEQPALLVPPGSDPKPRSFWRRYGWKGVAIVLAIAALFAIKKWLEPDPIPLRIETGPELTPAANNPYPILREGQRHQFAAQPATADTARYFWELRDVFSGDVEQRDTGRYFDYTAEGYGRDKWVIVRGPGRRADSLLLHIHCAVPPPMPQWNMPEVPALEDKSYEFGIAPPGPDAGVQWIFNGRDTLRGAKVSYTFAETGEATVECKVFRDSTYCYSWEQRKFTIGAGKPILSLADLIYDDTPPTVVRQSPKPWVWLLCFLPLLPAVWFLRRWWKQRREKPVSKPVEILVGEHPIHDKAPYFIPYLPPDGKISTPPDFYRMAEVLRRREESEHRELDVPASVRATVDGGGFPTLLDKSNTTPPDYLFLIERASAQDQQGRLFERLSSFFLRQDAPLTVYFHDGNFRSFWNEAHPQGVPFEFLHKQHSDCRLVLIGTGHGLLDPRNTREPALLRPLLGHLLHWKKSLFLSTLPVSGWFAPEVLLHRHFLLFPADAEGIRTGLEALDALEEYEPEPYEKWESALASRRSDRNPRFQAWESAEQHRAFLQPDADAFRWLCGLAVSVAPDFALTVAIGRKLGIEVSHDRLLRLTRIPWLSRNEPDTRLRLELLALLTDEEERLAREAVAEELEAVRQSVEGSFAHIEWKTNLAIHRFALHPENPERRQTLRDLMQLGLLSGSQMQELDGLARRRLLPPHLAKAGYGIAEYLDQPDPKPFFTRPMRLALIWAALALGLLFLAGQQQRVLPPSLIKTVTQSDSAVIWHNQAIDTALAIHRLSAYSQWENHDSARQAAVALFEKALLARTPYPLAERNLRAFMYNIAAQGFNFAMQDSIRGLSDLPFTLDEKSLLPVLPDSVQRSKQFGALMFAASFFKSATPATDTTNRLGWAARHGYGLCAYYLTKDYQAFPLDSARASYEEIMRLSGGMYFDSIRTTMPVNLQTLLIEAGQIAPDSIRFTLRGQVLDAATGRPITGATLRAADAATATFARLRANTGNMYRAATDAQGRYTIEGVPAATTELLLYAEAPGYEAATLRSRPQAELPAIRLQPSKAAVEAADWQRAIAADTPEAYSEYLAKHPEGPNADEARRRQTEGLSTRERNDWEEAQRTNAVAAYERYKSRHPNGAFVPQADAAIRALQAKAAADAAIAANTIPAYDAFLSGPHKDSEHAPDLRRRRDALQEAADYRDAIAANTTDAYDAYLGKWPSGANAADAARRRDALRPPPANNSAIVQKLEADMVRVAGGSFTMGCKDAQRDGSCDTDEKPPREVQVPAFSIGKYEVTQAQWRAVMGNDPSNFKNCDECPVEQVTWNDIQEFLRKLNAQTGKRYRLPTEAEWEYAARGGNQSRGYLYSGSNTIDEVAWYSSNSGSKTRPVGGKKPNELGLYDMSGNVWEWCEDDWHDNYNGAPTDGSAWVDKPRGGDRVLRGGSWGYESNLCRAANRYGNHSSYRSSFVGFRLARD